MRTWIVETLDNPYIDIKVNTEYEGELDIEQINELGLTWWACEECEKEEFEIIDKYTYKCKNCGHQDGIPYLP